MKAAWLYRTMARHMRLHRLTAMAAALSFFALGLLAGTSRLGIPTVRRWAGFTGQDVHVIVYLTDEVDEDGSRSFADLLRRVPGVTQATVVSPEDAFTRFKASAVSFGVDGNSLENLEATYFPRSIEVRLLPGRDLDARATELAQRLRGAPGVAQVDTMSGGLARLAAWSSFARRLGMVVLTTLALVTLAALVAVFVRLRVALARRTAVLVQLGETAFGIRLPAGLWMAAAAMVGGGGAATGLSLLWRPLVQRLERSLGMVALTPLPVLGREEIAVGLAVLLALGLGLGYTATPVPEADRHA